MDAPAATGLVDCHAHVVLEDTFGTAGALGPELSAEGFRVGDWWLRGVRYRGSAFMDPEVRLARMDEADIALAVLSPNPLTFLPHVDAGVAIDFARAHNDALATMVAAHPDRLVGLAQLPMQAPEAAADELRRAVELGLVGAGIGTDVGVPLDHPSLGEVWATATDLDVPVAIHPAPPGIDTPTDARINRLDLELHTGFANDESVAVAELVLGGVLERHPTLDVLVSHGGGATAVLAGRWRSAATTRSGNLGIDGPDAVDAGLRRLWFDTHMGSDTAVAALVAEVGTDRLVLGTNFAGWDDHGPDLHGVEAAVLTDNARRLLRLDR